MIFVRTETFELFMESIGTIGSERTEPLKIRVEPYCTELENLIDCVIVFGTDKTNMQAIRLFTKRATPPILSIERV